MNTNVSVYFCTDNKDLQISNDKYQVLCDNPRNSIKSFRVYVFMSCPGFCFDGLSRLWDNSLRQDNPPPERPKDFRRADFVVLIKEIAFENTKNTRTLTGNKKT